MTASVGAIVIEGHVQGLSNTRALGELGIPVYVLDVVHCLAQHSKYCTRYFRCPPFHSEAFVLFLIDLAEKEHLQGWFLIGSNDHIVEQLSLHEEQLRPYYTMLVPDKTRLYDIINKARLLQVAVQCGTTIPATCYVDTIEQASDFRYPLLIKGCMGLSFYKATHCKAIQVDSPEELHRTLQALPSAQDVMIQELIPFDRCYPVVSFTCFAVKGEVKTYWMGQKLREHPIKYGTATMSESVDIPAVLHEARPLVQALAYTGICEIEFMFDPRDKQYKLIEINPRTWLWVGLAKACGIDYAKIAYRYAQGIEQTYPTQYTTGIKWRNSITDFVFGMQAILRGHISLRDYLRSLHGPIVHAVWSWHDPMPGVMFPLMSFYIAKKRR